METTKSQDNPSTTPARRVTEANRVPMSLPLPKLSVPDLPGYFLYWHLGKNVRAALRAGYTHVQDEDVELNQHGVANSVEDSGSTDLGSNISIAAGGTVSDENPEPERLYLMKLPIEWRRQDEAKIAEVNENIARAIRAGNIGADKDPDAAKRYMKQGQDLFFPKNRT